MAGLPSYMLTHEVVRVVPAATPDEFNNAVLDYGEAATRTPVRAWLQQDSAQIVATDGGTPLEAGWLLMANTLFERRDRVEWAGLVFELDGQPEPAYDMAGFHHMEAKLRVVAG